MTAPDLIYHLALRDEWASAVESGADYRRSTLGRSLDEEGFIHCSFRDQVAPTADLLFRGRDDVLLLSIDPGRVPGPVRVESLDGGGTAFPHIYGPLPLAAVVRAEPVPVAADGTLLVASLLGRPGV